MVAERRLRHHRASTVLVARPGCTGASEQGALRTGRSQRACKSGSIVEGQSSRQRQNTTTLVAGLGVAQRRETTLALDPIEGPNLQPFGGSRDVQRPKLLPQADAVPNRNTKHQAHGDNATHAGQCGRRGSPTPQ